ncbi:uncharacterized protein TrAtP1_010193 [Trichoderma atroviride]|uniref:uncharacterized protein n=1 Tax=Hypocrea atroviridis TaxID=63577 RepID=UPI00331669EB|nr:hypothetical protein TrAtP1_010193 [Trichoderma atroviride]
MASEFHLFTSLPTEIRLKVWEHALRPYSPSRPGAHFFSVTNFKEDGDQLARLRAPCVLGSRCKLNHGHTYYLAAPKFGISHSWTNNNPSAYLWDFGMWSACSESREIIEDHYKTEYWAAKLLEDSKCDYPPKPDADACVPFIFPRSNEDWRFAIRPNRDLICFQPLNPLTIGYHRKGTYLTEDISMVNPTTGLRDVKNMAFEFDSSWCDDLKVVSCPQDFRAYFEEKSPRGLFIRLFLELDACGERYDPIWLIDYGLKQDPPKRDLGEDRPRIPWPYQRTFFANDRKFVQVGRFYTDEYKSTERWSALDFLEELSDMLGGVSPGHAFHHYEGKFSWDGSCPICEENARTGIWYDIRSDIEVLVCERNE